MYKRQLAFMSSAQLQVAFVQVAYMYVSTEQIQVYGVIIYRHSVTCWMHV